MALGVRKFVAASMFALALVAVLSLFAYAASGPSATRTVKNLYNDNPDGAIK